MGKAKGKLAWANVVDLPWGVVGVARVARGYPAPLHRHPVDETYYIIKGEAKMWIGGGIRTVRAPCHVHIPGGELHALTPTSPCVILVYTFPRGPFGAIRYEWPASEPTLLSRL